MLEWHRVLDGVPGQINTLQALNFHETTSVADSTPKPLLGVAADARGIFSGEFTARAGSSRSISTDAAQHRHHAGRRSWLG